VSLAVMGLRGCGVGGNALDIAVMLDYHIDEAICALRPIRTTATCAVALRACTTGRRYDDTTFHAAPSALFTKTHKDHEDH